MRIACRGERLLAVSWFCRRLPNGKLDPATWPNTGIDALTQMALRAPVRPVSGNFLWFKRAPGKLRQMPFRPDHPQKKSTTNRSMALIFMPTLINEPSSFKMDPWRRLRRSAHVCNVIFRHQKHGGDARCGRSRWTLRPPISKISHKTLPKGRSSNLQARRADMKHVCESCHGTNIISNFYQQFDSLVEMYNQKFAVPGTNIMKALKENKLIKDIEFDNKIGWTWYEIWHHQGRRARHGAAMLAPDYTQWHGMYEVAKQFYSEFIPQVEELIEKAKKAGNLKGADAVSKVVYGVLNSPEHLWYLGKEPAEITAKRKEAAQRFKDRYLKD